MTIRYMLRRIAAWFALEVLNFAVLQWFGVRLARRVEIEVDWADIAAGRLAPGQVGTYKQVLGWTLLRWVWPCTGWWSPMRYIRRRPVRTKSFRGHVAFSVGRDVEFGQLVTLAPTSEPKATP